MLRQEEVGRLPTSWTLRTRTTLPYQIQLPELPSELFWAGDFAYPICSCVKDAVYVRLEYDMEYREHGLALGFRSVSQE